MDRIRKALSPKSAAAKEDDSSSDTEQQHKTYNKVCITAELLLTGCHNGDVCSVWDDFFISFFSIWKNRIVHGITCGTPWFDVLTWSENWSSQKLQPKNVVEIDLPVRLFYYMLVEESVNQTKPLITLLKIVR